MIRLIIKAITWYFVTLSIMSAILLVWSYNIDNTPVMGYLAISILYSISIVLILLYMIPDLTEDEK